MISAVFACTASKTLPAVPQLEARWYRTLRPTVAFQRWSAALEQASDTTTVARLYKGGYWSIARTLVHDTTLPLRALVASAGVGLRDFHERIPAYQAVFNNAEIDAVPEAHHMNGQIWWWRHLGGRDRLRGLAEGPSPRIVVALPGQYLRVAMPDLLYLQAELGPRALTVFTTDTRAIDELGGSAVALQGRMSRVLGGAAGHLTVRALDHVVRAAERPEDITPGRARALLARVLQKAPAKMYPTRTRQSAEDVRRWIRDALESEDPPTSATSALRRFRSQGLGHEQKRFASLFRELQQGAS